MTVRLHASFRLETPSGRQSRLELELPEPATVAALLRRLELEHDEDHMLLAVNGRMVSPEHELREGDVVRIMPAIAGGMRVGK